MDSVIVESSDSVTITKTVTITLREAQEPDAPPDTVRVCTVTDRERTRLKSDVRSQKVDVRVVHDTVYVEKSSELRVES